ncbi:plastoglobulin-1, chloroplastic [Cornus florida]|uniref:plastoglobulin-1, chloroplastic n=1 Tax=Cornus florida TaxID=4283 RepID=UPI00289C00FF|nr:plastoglobulin-1, chloroplastic [Cornus florida]
MSLPLTSQPSLVFSQNPNNHRTLRFFSSKTPSLSFSVLPFPNPRSSSLRLHSTLSGDVPDPISGAPPSSGGTSGDGKSDGANVDEWGDKAEPETEPSTRMPDADPPKDEDEWGGVGVRDDYDISGNGSAPAVTEPTVEDDKLGDLKRCLADTVYGTDLGFRASGEVRAEVLELVTQLEAANPTPAPTEATELLDGNWVLLYTAFSELVPLLAAGTTPFLKVQKISQEIKTSSLTIENSTTLSSTFATFSFSATATFEVRSPTRIQVEFKEGSLKPPEIKSSIDLPENVDIFGQKINLLPVQQSINPLQEVVANIARTLSGQPPLKVPIPGERTKSWLLITYLDKDLRISRGDAGLFVLAKEGSSLLYQ